MSTWSKYADKEIIIRGIKIIIPLILLWYLYTQLFLNNSINDLFRQLAKSISVENSYILGLTFLLMIINWALEAKRWQIIIGADHKISYQESISAILSGLSLAVITPARSGEYAGRLARIKKGRKLKAGLLALIAIYSQILITIICGIIALYLFLSFNGYFGSRILGVTSGILIMFIIALLLIAYYQYYKLDKIFLGINRMLRLSIKFRFFRRKISFIKLHNLLQLSFLRYIIFTVQYLLLLILFGINIPLIEGIVMIGCIFFVQSFLPTPILAELGIRSGVAVFFLGHLTNNILGVMSAAMAIWMINLIIPAIIGAFIISGFGTTKTSTV